MMRCIGLFVVITCVHGLDNGLGLTPRLAYSTWNFFTIHVNESDVHEIAAVLERTGLKDLGYDTINIDAGSLDRDPHTGKLFPNPHLFPSGLRNLSNFLHGNGFKFGAYNDISGHTCGSGPGAGSLHHYTQDAETFALEWQVQLPETRPWAPTCNPHHRLTTSSLISVESRCLACHKRTAPAWWGGAAGLCP